MIYSQAESTEGKLLLTSCLTKQLLEAFEKVEKPYPLISEIAKLSSEVDNRFVFHMGILHDQGFLQYLTRHGQSPFEPDLDEIDDFSWADFNVRLTAQGYDFLSALHQKNIWNAIKGDLKENSIETVWKVAQGVATKIASTQLQKYFDESVLK
ncbi:DUF2513 domain-containing protein [Photobacterium angustum]|nr:DUF2513 domain-containing protein [Photobacterium angustum]KJF80857.1 hypothetical protein UB36_15725 [Photobacterium damselae subsp. damselae]KJG38434.1 hypothetical protein UA35_15690 [Photobacterium angustum]KJG44320.1 hypothetical protein UA31_15730 [Photobacterium angustum]KJG48122.1 hypothetical protein UA30_15630 [Photobacterium angustum]KJG51999.1 hypothetical protein UA34_16505 [Photobacterium angustum]